MEILRPLELAVAPTVVSSISLSGPTNYFVCPIQSRWVKSEKEAANGNFCKYEMVYISMGRTYMEVYFLVNELVEGKTTSQEKHDCFLLIFPSIQ